MMGVGMPQGLLLKQFGEYLRAAFGQMAYHVGSSVREKTLWRDVDVRVMLPDEEWEAMQLGKPENPHGNAKWRAITLAWSAFGKTLTGLPIDFQLQQRTHANTEYTHEKGGIRSALFQIDDELPRA